MGRRLVKGEFGVGFYFAPAAKTILFSSVCQKFAYSICFGRVGILIVESKFIAVFPLCYR